MQSYMKTVVNKYIHRDCSDAGRLIKFSPREQTASNSASALVTLWTLLILSTLASGGELKGTVINGSTGKPAAGDEVVLLTLSQDGMTEGASAKTDHAGRFQLSIANAEESHLIRITHQGVTYHKMVEPNLKPLSVKVYDAAVRLDGVSAVMDVTRFEAKSDSLEVKQLITVRNTSKPPRTLIKDRALEFQLPPEAQIQSGLVQIEDGRPLKQKPVPGDEKGQYFFPSPLRPGDTRFAIVYRLPYSGEAVIEPTLRNPLERFVIMLPGSMKFEPKASDIFRPIPNVTPDNVLGTAPVKAGQTLTFRISGSGTLLELQGNQQTQDIATLQKEGPGGGLGRPIEAPDPLERYRWQILAGVVTLLAGGAVWVTRRATFPYAKDCTGIARPALSRTSRDSQARISMSHKRRGAKSRRQSYQE